jgi:hypothetical protein
LLLLKIALLFLLVAPCQGGTSAPSVLAELLGRDTWLQRGECAFQIGPIEQSAIQVVDRDFGSEGEATLLVTSRAAVDFQNRHWASRQLGEQARQEPRAEAATRFRVVRIG